MPELQYTSSLVSALNVGSASLQEHVLEMSFTDEPLDYLENIQDYLAKGEKAYLTHDYDTAINHFKDARKLIAGLIISQKRLINYSGILPTSIETEKLLMEAGLKFIEASQTKATAYSVPVHVKSLETIPPELQVYEKIGFHTKDVDDEKVQQQINLSISLLNNDRSKEAIKILKGELLRLGKSNNVTEHALRGSVALTLGSTYIISGKHKIALKTINIAKNYFRKAKDLLGEAQAFHNEGILFQHVGKAYKALESFNAARAIYQKITGSKPITANPPTHGVERPGAPTSTIPISTPSVTRTLLDSRFRGPSVFRSNDLHSMSFLGDPDSDTASVRLPGINGGVGSLHIPKKVSSLSKSKSWTFGVLRGKEVLTLEWKNGKRPYVSTLERTLYKKRIRATTLEVLRGKDDYANAGQLSIWLSHLYNFSLPQSLGDAYHGKGDYANALAYYTSCARYSYMNIPIEAPALWGRMAKNFVAWGDSLWKAGNIAECKSKYSQIILKKGTVPNSSFMFSNQKFTGPAKKARKLIEALKAGNSVAIDPVLGIPIFDIWARWQYLNAGLDFFGTTYQPIFTYDYLREVALGFVNQAIRAEQEYIDFQTKAEAETAQRQQLETFRDLAEKDKMAASEMHTAADKDYWAAYHAKGLAEKRTENAKDAKSEYWNVAYWQYRLEAAATLHAAEQHAHYGTIGVIADAMSTGSYGTLGTWAEMTAATKYLRGKKTREYESARMQDAIDELAKAETIAERQRLAAEARKRAALYQKEAAILRHNRAINALTAFDNEIFTPRLWTDMAYVMHEISEEFKNRAIRAAKLMEHAYNFEMDTAHCVISSSYTGVGAKGLLGSDRLLQDIESFAIRYVTEQQQKESHIKDVISLAVEYPMHMHTFRETGEIAFETRLYDFDRLHPGFYRQRLHAVEVEIVGLLPPEGVNGTLSSGLISQYRTDVDENGEPGAKTRVHGMDTMALSEFEVRRDGLLFRMDQRKLGLFEGQGIAASWKLELPKRSNNLDYRLITDIRLVLYYSALHSSRLEDAIAKQPPLPGEMVRSREFLLRYTFPVSWYAFQDTGDLAFEILARHLPLNQEDFVIEKLTLMVITSEGTSAKGVTCRLKLPGKLEKSVLLDETGNIAKRPRNNLNTVIGGNLDGKWQLSLGPKPGSDLVDADGKLKGKLIEQIAVVLEYSFKWVK